MTVPRPSPVIEPPQSVSAMPVEYYRRHAARVRQLAREATTPAIKERLRAVADECDRLAERVQIPTAPQQETT